ncbi:methylated-DNA--[protein]-cysteine S-methyltransferase [Demequina oxidasica]|uniref:methylated-DNA--[protein]-cysteine S-methyltransferase n=1 Tax=Demequina oxidasica TaxID=676199 RepID=UPI000781B176|nr:methylated-DNA--[protein]-cysteine S-methyltransferase [Demequina oxidasica]
MPLPLVAAEYDTPFGDLAVLVSPEDGTVRSAGFHAAADMALRVAPSQRGRGWEPGDLPHIDAAVAAWLSGDGSLLRDIDVQQEGGPFFQEVWETMRDVPNGETISYRDLAEAAGRPRAMRAAGTACARNNIALFIPCHRVIKSGGALGNYGFGGVEMKAGMIALEHKGAAQADDAALRRSAAEASV